MGGWGAGASLHGVQGTGEGALLEQIYSLLSEWVSGAPCVGGLLLTMSSDCLDCARVCFRSMILLILFFFFLPLFLNRYQTPVVTHLF